MNDADRLTPASARRLRGLAAECEARAVEYDEAAAGLAPPGAGYREKREADKLHRRAEHERAKAQRFATRAARSVGTLSVSDHAIVRYLERRYGLDVSAYAAEILPPAVADLAARMGDCELDVDTDAGRHRVTVKGGCVVTVTIGPASTHD